MIDELIERTTLKALVAKRIVETVGSQELAAGARLLDDKMSSALGDGKATWRETSQLLEQPGVLAKSENGGTCNTKLSTQSVQDICEVRSLLEPEVAALAHWKLTRQDFHELVRLRERMGLERERKDYLNASNSGMAFRQFGRKSLGNVAPEEGFNREIKRVFTETLKVFKSENLIWGRSPCVQSQTEQNPASGKVRGDSPRKSETRGSV